MFRPEMLEPMGFPKDVHVHGWGISLERPTMIRCECGFPSLFDTQADRGFAVTASTTSARWLATRFR